MKIQREKRKPVNLGFNFIDMCYYNDLKLILILLSKFLLSQSGGHFCFVLAFEVGSLITGKDKSVYICTSFSIYLHRWLTFLGGYNHCREGTSPFSLTVKHPMKTDILSGADIRKDALLV